MIGFHSMDIETMTKNAETSTNGSQPVSSEAATSAAENMARSAHAGIDRTAEAVHPSIDRAAAGVHRAVESADDMANHAVDALESAGIKSDEMIRTGSSYMRDHPVLTLSLAVTAGYVLSRLMASHKAS